MATLEYLNDRSVPHFLHFAGGRSVERRLPECRSSKEINILCVSIPQWNRYVVIRGCRELGDFARRALMVDVQHKIVAAVVSPLHSVRDAGAVWSPAHCRT